MGKVDFEQMFTMFSERLKVIAYSVTKNWHSAEDVVQEAYIKAYLKMDSIESMERIGSWLSAITVRTAIDFLRAEKRRAWVGVDQELIDYLQLKNVLETSTEQEVEFNLFKEDLYTSMHQLGEPYKEVLLLKGEYGMKEAEIADTLQLKATTVKTRLHRARKQLKQTMIEKNSA